jgi:hypothetical protein
MAEKEEKKDVILKIDVVIGIIFIRHLLWEFWSN